MSLPMTVLLEVKEKKKYVQGFFFSLEKETFAVGEYAISNFTHTL